MTVFRELLKNLMAEINISNNFIIGETGINRSTYYKILNGKRLPTKEQLNLIINAAGFEGQDAQLLKSAYFESVMGEYDQSIYRKVKQGLRCISEAEKKKDADFALEFRKDIESPKSTVKYHGRDETERAVYEFLYLAAQNKEEPEIRIFTPVEVTGYIYKFLVLMSFPEMKSKLHQLLCVSNIAGELYSTQIDEIYYAISMILDRRIDYQASYFYDPSRVLGNRNLVFPYYIECSGSLLLINKDAADALWIVDRQIIRGYREQLNGIFRDARPIVEEIEEFIKEQKEMQSGVEIVPSYFISDVPYLLYQISPGTVLDQIPAEFREIIKEYYRIMDFFEGIHIISLEVIRRLVSEKSFCLFSMKIELTDRVITAFLEAVVKRLGQGLILADPRKITLPIENRMAVISEREFIIAQPASKNILCIRERNLTNLFASVFSKYAEDMMYSKEGSERELTALSGGLAPKKRMGGILAASGN